MTTYRFDGSFEGFLCAAAECLERQDSQPGFVRDGAPHAAGLFDDDRCDVPTVRDRAVAFRAAFIGKASREAFATARYAFHSRKEGVEQLLWHYLQCAMAAGKTLAGMLTEEPVCSVNRIARQVSHEAHKFKGFVRFQELEAGFLYARIEPKADIVALIAPHFVERVGDRPWMIHDIRRCQAALYDLTSWRVVAGVELTAEPDLSESEHDYAVLWQRYFQRHAIAERHNPKLQQKHVPLRYRKHLTEFTSP